MKHEWKFINVANICCVDNCIRINVTHVRDLSLQATAKGFFASAHDDVRLNTPRAQLRNTVLGWLCLLLTTRTNKRHKRDVQIANIVTASLVTELTNCLKERENFNVSDGSSDFSNDHISVVCSNTTDSALDLICDVRNYLNCLSQVITATFSGQNSLINGPCRCIRATCEILVNETLVVTKVEVGLATIICYEHFTVFKRVHRARVNVDVRVKFLHCDAQAAHLQQTTKRRSSETLTEGTCNATCHEYVLWH